MKDSNGVLLLAEFLRVDKTIKRIDLSNNRIGPRGAYALAELFKTGANRTLKTLNLHGNRILHKGAVQLAKGLEVVNHSLEFLDVSNNHIGYHGVVALQTAVSKRISSQKVPRKKSKNLSVNLNDQNQPSKGNNDYPASGQLQLSIISNFVYEEVWNTISHAVGFLFALFAALITVYRISDYSTTKIFSALVYCFSLLFLYASSSLYHSFFKLGYTKDIFQRLDHAAIFVLIAGSYTPILMGGPLTGFYGNILLAFVWVLAIIGITLVVTCFDQYPVLELCLYLLMGWVSLFIVPVVYIHWEEFIHIHIYGLCWYAAGGLIYTSGVYFFLKGQTIPIHHAVWHVFVVVASICHFNAVFFYVLPTPPPVVPYW